MHGTCFLDFLVLNTANDELYSACWVVSSYHKQIIHIHPLPEPRKHRIEDHVDHRRVITEAPPGPVQTEVLCHLADDSVTMAIIEMFCAHSNLQGLALTGPICPGFDLDRLTIWGKQTYKIFLWNAIYLFLLRKRDQLRQKKDAKTWHEFGPRKQTPRLFDVPLYTPRYTWQSN